MDRLTAVSLGLLAGGLLAAPFSLVGFLLIPMAVLSMVCGGLATRRAVRADERVRLPAAATAVAAVVAVSGLVVPGLLRPMRSVDDGDPLPANAVRVVPYPRHMHEAADLSTDWVDADKASLQQGRVRVEVAEAWIGQATAVKKSKNPTSYLYVRVRLYRSKTGKEIVAGAFAPGLAWDRGYRATIRNGDATPVDQLPAVPGRARIGGPSSAADAAQDIADEIIAFDLPPALNGLRLELPAAAWGGTGTFRFALPVSFIRQFQGLPGS